MRDSNHLASPGDTLRVQHARAWAMLALAVTLSGCQAVGPVTVPRDRMNYSDAIARSWKQQTLLNIVKLRYLDTPVYLDISSVVTSYELGGELTVGGTFYPSRTNSNATNAALGVSGSYSETPTITYSVLTGDKLVNSLLRPLPPDTIFAMINSGHPADVIMRAAVQAIDGVHNGSNTAAGARPEDPRFEAAIRDLRNIELAGALGVRFERSHDEVRTFVTLRRGVDGNSDSAIIDFKRELGIPDGVDVLRVVPGLVPQHTDELALLTRPMQRLLSELAVGVDVPSSDLKDGRATARPPRGPGMAPRLVRIRSGEQRPHGVFASVRYRDHWFWVDDTDLASKRMFMFLMMFTSLSASGTVPQPPVLTIPTR